MNAPDPDMFHRAIRAVEPSLRDKLGRGAALRALDRLELRWRAVAI
ncbi:MAG: hypothetical protein ABWY81_05415 [Jiangellaceae bacterium]